jgi:hypothetical protein
MKAVRSASEYIAFLPTLITGKSYLWLLFHTANVFGRTPSKAAASSRLNSLDSFSISFSWAVNKNAVDQ